MEVNDRGIEELTLLPPAKGLCPECAVDHPPGDPHNAQSFFYCFKFNIKHGRSPTWADAMSHCSDAIKAHWVKHLTHLGVDINSENKTGSLTSEAEVANKLKELI